MLEGPVYIQFYPTLRCNRSCDFCFNRQLPVLPNMPSGAFRTMLANLPATVQALDIIGGEPTLHTSLVDLVKHACDRGMHVNISSNGSNIGRLREIADGDPDVTIGISVNDLDTLGNVRAFILSRSCVVKTVLSRNLEASLVEHILALEPVRYYLIYRDALLPGELKETRAFPEYLRMVTDWSASMPTEPVYCSGFLPDRSHPELAAVRCPAGTTKLGILPDGSVYPCNLLFGRPEFLLGNVLRDTFREIWRHPSLAFFRTFPGNLCPLKHCHLHQACHGGCPAQSLMLTGSLERPDPRCVFAAA